MRFWIPATVPCLPPPSFRGHPPPWVASPLLVALAGPCLPSPNPSPNLCPDAQPTPGRWTHHPHGDTPARPFAVADTGSPLGTSVPRDTMCTPKFRPPAPTLAWGVRHRQTLWTEVFIRVGTFSGFCFCCLVFPLRAIDGEIRNGCIVKKGR